MELHIEGLTINMIPEGDVVVAEVPNGWERATLRIWCEQLRKMPTSRCALDVGAYTGIYSLLAQAARCNVVAFEPLPRVYRRLVLNGVRQALMLGLSDTTNSRASMHISNDVLLPSGSSMQYHPTKPTQHLEAVAVTTGDSVCHRLDIGLIKLDVERHEAQALAGLRKTIRRCRPVVIVECLSLGELEGVRHLLRWQDYDMRRINDTDDCLDCHMQPETGKTNFLFTPL